MGQISTFLVLTIDDSAFRKKESQWYPTVNLLNPLHKLFFHLSFATICNFRAL